MQYSSHCYHTPFLPLLHLVIPPCVAIHHSSLCYYALFTLCYNTLFTPFLLSFIPLNVKIHKFSMSNYAPFILVSLCTIPPCITLHHSLLYYYPPLLWITLPPVTMHHSLLSYYDLFLPVFLCTISPCITIDHSSMIDIGTIPSLYLLDPFWLQIYCLFNE